MYKNTKEARDYVARKKYVDDHYNRNGEDEDFIIIEHELALWAADNESKIFAPSVMDGLTLEELVEIKKGS